MSNQKASQEKFHRFVNELMKEPHSTYQSVISTVYSLIEDKRLVSLDRMLKDNYPEYYKSHE